MNSITQDKFDRCMDIYIFISCISGTQLPMLSGPGYLQFVEAGFLKICEVFNVTRDSIEEQCQNWLTREENRS